MQRLICDRLCRCSRSQTTESHLIELGAIASPTRLLVCPELRVAIASDAASARFPKQLDERARDLATSAHGLRSERARRANERHRWRRHEQRWERFRTAMDRTSRVRKRIPRDQLGSVCGEVERETPVFFGPSPPISVCVCAHVRPGNTRSGSSESTEKKRGRLRSSRAWLCVCDADHRLICLVRPFLGRAASLCLSFVSCRCSRTWRWWRAPSAAMPL